MMYTALLKVFPTSTRYRVNYTYGGVTQFLSNPSISIDGETITATEYLSATGAFHATTPSKVCPKHVLVFQGFNITSIEVIGVYVRIELDLNKVGDDET